MDIAKTTTEITLLRRALKTAPTVSIKVKIKSKIARLKQYIEDFSVPTAKLAKSLLGSKRKVLAYSTQEFNDAIGRLSMKGEYSFLKGMGKGKIKDDLKREAKPVGYRFVGRDNFKKPTRQEIIDGRKNGTVYMENRANRSDVVRPAKLEYGGVITQEQYDEITTEHRPFAVKSGSSIRDVINSTIALNLACKKRDVSVQDYKNYGKFAKGGAMEHGLKKGDTIKDDLFWEDSVVVNNSKTGIAKVDLDKGTRTQMAKGGGVGETWLVDVSLSSGKAIRVMPMTESTFKKLKGNGKLKLEKVSKTEARPYSEDEIYGIADNSNYGNEEYGKGGGVGDYKVGDIFQTNSYPLAISLIEGNKIYFDKIATTSTMNYNEYYLSEPEYYTLLKQELDRLIKDGIFRKIKGKIVQYAKGGYLANENALMVANNNKQIFHHTKEMADALKNKKNVPAWVVAKVNRSASDLSDATHYMEGQDEQYAKGGGVGDEAKNWFSVKFKLPDGRISWTTTYSSMGEKYAKNEVLEDFAASEIIEIRKATKNEIDHEMNSKYANGGGVGNNGTYTDYERQVTDMLCDTMDITNGDAQGIAEANESLIKQSYNNGVSPSDVVATIDGGSMAKGGVAEYKKGGNITSIEKRVLEVNEMIKKGNELGIKVVDESVTWESPMKYKPLKYSNGVLYIEYQELDLYKYKKGMGTVWKTKKDKLTKNTSDYGYGDAGYAQKLELSNIAKMYRKALNHYEKYGYYEKGGGVANSTTNVTNDMRGEDSDDYGTFEIYKNGGEIKVSVVNSNKQYNEKAYNWILGDFDKDGVANADDTKPLDKNKTKRIDEPSITSGIKSLISLKNTLDGKMYSFIDELKDIAPNKSKIYARTKTPYSVLDKLIKKRLSTITDLIGTTVVTNDKNELDAVKKYVQSGEMGKVIEFEDMYKSPKKGYRAYHFLIDRDGMSIELQLKTKRQKALNELTHEPYKLGNINVPLQLKMTEVANRADEGDKDAIKDYNEFMKQPNIEKVFYAKSGDKMAKGSTVTTNVKAILDAKRAKIKSRKSKR